jgi:hyperosmotically inducible protein
MKALQYAVIVVACALTLVGCRSTTGRSFGQHWDDKTITTQVKTRLTADTFRNLFSTGVGTQFGVVYLTGNVATEEQRAEAGRIASRVAGVREVRNELVVVPRHTTGPQGTAAAPSASPAGAAAATAAGGGSLALSGRVTAVDRDSGDVTVRTQTGDITLRLPPAALREVTQGQALSISAGR